LKDKRQIYRVILQLMSYSALAVFVGVMFSTTFIADDEKKQTLPDRIEMSLQQLGKGKFIAMIHRKPPISFITIGVIQEIAPYFLMGMYLKIPVQGLSISKRVNLLIEVKQTTYHPLLIIL